MRQQRRAAVDFMSGTLGSCSDHTPGDRRHNRNVITILHRSRLFLQVSDVFVIDVEVDERPQLSVVGVEVASQLRMLRHKGIQGLTYRRSGYLHGRLLPYILPQGSWNV